MGNRSTRRKTSRCRVENQQTQPTYEADWELNSSHTGGRRVLSSLSHPCTRNHGIMSFLEANRLQRFRAFVSFYFERPKSFATLSFFGNVVQQRFHAITLRSKRPSRARLFERRLT